MPFIGKDWRSPGEAWVKTEDGSWEKVKILPSIPSSASSASSRQSNHLSSLPSLPQPPPQRSMAVTIKSTREVAGYNTISEAFYRLDFVSAISDVRRFHYVTKLLHLLINQNLTSLSGCATKVLFSLLQQLTRHVSRSRQHVHVLRNLLHDVKRMISSYYCWGRPLGSTLLWDQHLQTLDRICAQAEAIQIQAPELDEDELLMSGLHGDHEEEGEEGKENQDCNEGSEDSDEEVAAGGGKKKETDGGNGSGKKKTGTKELPEELVREILLRLSDYDDVVNTSLAFRTPHLLDESHIWRELCRYHFTKQQVRQAGPKCTRTEGPMTGRVDFEQVFHLLKRSVFNSPSSSFSPRHHHFALPLSLPNSLLADHDCQAGQACLSAQLSSMSRRPSCLGITSLLFVKSSVLFFSCLVSINLITPFFPELM